MDVPADRQGIGGQRAVEIDLDALIAQTGGEGSAPEIDCGEIFMIGMPRIGRLPANKEFGVGQEVG